jgi:hypothetical protein
MLILIPEIAEISFLQWFPRTIGQNKKSVRGYVVPQTTEATHANFDNDGQLI